MKSLSRMNAKNANWSLAYYRTSLRGGGVFKAHSKPVDFLSWLDSFVFILNSRRFSDLRNLRDLRLNKSRRLFVWMFLSLEECYPLVGAVAIGKHHADEFP